MKFLNLLYRWPKLVIHYAKISWSFDFMLRYFFLWFIHLLNSFVFNKLQTLVDRIQPILHKEFIFKTTFWTYLWRTVNHWTVLDHNYEPALRKVIDSNYKKYSNINDKVFLDIWAHIWRYAVELTKNYWFKTIAIEANPDTYKILKINTILSDIWNNIELYNFALWDKDWFLKFDNSIFNDASNKIVTDSNFIWWIEVSVKQFDSLNFNLDIKNIKLLIMDVEWFEFEVLQWMRVFLSNIVWIDIIVEIMDSTPSKNITINYMHDLWFSSNQIDWLNFHFWK